MPLEIPGKPLGRLPDRRSMDICPNCFRSYRAPKVQRDPKKPNKVSHHCPFCGSRIKDYEPASADDAE